MFFAFYQVAKAKETFRHDGVRRPAPIKADHRRTCRGEHVRRDCKYG